MDQGRANQSAEAHVYVFRHTHATTPTRTHIITTRLPYPQFLARTIRTAPTKSNFPNSKRSRPSRPSSGSWWRSNGSPVKRPSSSSWSAAVRTQRAPMANPVRIRCDASVRPSRRCRRPLQRRQRRHPAVPTRRRSDCWRAITIRCRAPHRMSWSDRKWAFYICSCWLTYSKYFTKLSFIFYAFVRRG